MMPEASDIGSQPFLWLVRYIGLYIHDAVRYRTLVYCLSHTYGMGIIVWFAIPRDMNPWLPMFDADGIIITFCYTMMASLFRIVVS